MNGDYVLIGNSAAALAAVDWIRKHDRQGSILLLNGERGPAYSRIAIPYYVSGELTLDQLLIRQPADYARAGATLIEEAVAAGIDPDAKEVALADGRRVGYGKLLVATGSICVAPPIRGLDSVKVHHLWTLDDALGMRAAAERARRAVVIGGGFIGMLAASALSKLDIEVTVVEMAAQLLPQLLDEPGGARFLDAVRARGASVRLGTAVESVAPAGSGVSVALAGGEALDADLLAVAAGVTPNLAAIGGGTLAVRRGVLVGEHLETNAAGVYAAGDVAEAKDFLGGGTAVHAIWPAAVEQGRIAGANMAGAGIAYRGSLGMNVVELFGVTLAQVGRFKEGPADDVRLLGAEGHALYRKVVVDREGIVVGAMYLGDGGGVAEMGVIHATIRRRARWREVSAARFPRLTYATAVRGAELRW